MQFLEGGGGAFAPNAPSWIRHCFLQGDLFVAELSTGDLFAAELST